MTDMNRVDAEYLAREADTGSANVFDRYGFARQQIHSGSNTTSIGNYAGEAFADENPTNLLQRIAVSVDGPRTKYGTAENYMQIGHPPDVQAVARVLHHLREGDEIGDLVLVRRDRT